MNGLTSMIFGLAASRMCIPSHVLSISRQYGRSEGFGFNFFFVLLMRGEPILRVEHVEINPRPRPMGILKLDEPCISNSKFQNWTARRVQFQISGFGFE